MEGEVLDRVLDLGCKAAHYNADNIASAPPNKCKEQENCSFSTHFTTQLGSLAGILDLPLAKSLAVTWCSPCGMLRVKLFSELKVVHIRLLIKLPEMLFLFFPAAMVSRIASTKCQTFRNPNLGILSDFCSLRLKHRGGLQGMVRCWAQDGSCIHTSDDCSWRRAHSVLFQCLDYTFQKVLPTRVKKPCFLSAAMTVYMLNMPNHQHIFWAAALPSGGCLGMRSCRTTEIHKPEVDVTCNSECSGAVMLILSNEVVCFCVWWWSYLGTSCFTLQLWLI